MKLLMRERLETLLHGVMFLLSSRASVLSSGTLGAAMEASLAHKKAIAISFPFNGWGSWTEDDIQTAVQVWPVGLGITRHHSFILFYLW